MLNYTRLLYVNIGFILCFNDDGVRSVDENNFIYDKPA